MADRSDDAPRLQNMIPGKVELHGGDCWSFLKDIPDNWFDSCVTDPPYALVSIVKRFGKDGSAPAQFGTDGRYSRASAGFMGKKWDTGDTTHTVEFWAEVLRVLKPGAHIVAFAGTRTYHRLACAIEDAGFEIRDQIGWCYGSGFPKSHDVSKGIDRSLGFEREKIITGTPVKRMIPGADQNKRGWEKNNGREYEPGRTVPVSEDAQRWEGWGTALKPAWEPICLARKPLGTGDINVRKNIECALQKMGVVTEIAWVEESAETASNIEKSQKSFLANVGSSVGNVSALEIATIKNEIETKSTNSTELGTLEMDKNISPPLEKDTSEPKNSFLTTTEGNAPVAEKRSNPSSRSTILKAEAQSTERQSATKSITISSSENSRPDTESFAGIATGLSDSQEHVLIKREGNSFVWPKGLPTFVSSKPLNVAANVLRWGTGAINVDGCRVGDFVNETPPGTDRYNQANFEQGYRPNAYGRDGEASADRRYTEKGSTNFAATPGSRGGDAKGRWPANIVLSVPEDEYELKPFTTPEEKRELYRWLSENA